MLTLRFLGGFEVWVNGTPAKCSPAPGRLLCRLALDANRPVARGRLWEELWPESDSADAVDINLRRVRKDVLGPEDHRLHTEGSIVLLDLDGAEVDFLRFQGNIEDGSLPALEEAVRLYRGEFLKRYLEESWLLDLRDELKTGFEDALKTLTEHALNEGNLLVAARHLRRFVESNPDYEWGWRELIETYAHMGNTTEALAAYTAYVEHIREYRLPLSPRIEEAVARVREEQQTRRLAEIREAPALPAAIPLDERLVVGGALPPASPFYVERVEDADVHDALTTPGATVRIKGPRQVGKSSLLARALHGCREAGTQVLLTDWQNLPHAALASAEEFYSTLAYKLADQAGLDADPASAFRPGRPPGDNFDRFVQLLLVPAAADRPIVWAIDEADRLFGCDFRDEVFGKLRAWHNDRALDPDSPWARFSLVLTYATEAHLFIANLNQSPFNVGTAVALKDFTPQQSAELSERYGRPLAREAEVERLHRLVGGHPFLTSRALYEAKRHGRTIDQLEETADEPDGPFRDHLERLRFTLGLNPELAEAVRAHLHEGAAPAMEPFLRLCAAGVMTGASPSQMRPRCALYDRYLRQALT